MSDTLKNLGALFAGGLAGYILKELTQQSPKQGVLVGAVGATVASAAQAPKTGLFMQGITLYSLGRAIQPIGRQKCGEQALVYGTLGRVSRPQKTDTVEGTKVYFSRWFEPYKEGEDGKLRTNFFEYITPGNAGKYAESGLYFIRDKDTRELVYVGRSGGYNERGDLYNRLYRHFQKHHPKYAATTYTKWGYEVQIAQVDERNIQRIPELEQHYILSENPRDNIEKLELFREGNQGAEESQPDSSGWEQETEAPF